MLAPLCAVRRGPLRARHLFQVLARRTKGETMNDRLIQGMLIAMKLIQDDGRERGVLECPLCKGKLAFVNQGPRAIRANCETADCLRFMS
jgi:hypothetical protein